MAQLRYKNLIRETTRHGKVVWYVRVKIDGKHKRARLKEAPGSPQFVSEYLEALASLTASKPERPAKAAAPPLYDMALQSLLCQP